MERVDETVMRNWKTVEAHLPDGLEAIAKEAKVLQVQYGDAKITSGSDLLRLILLHAGAGIGLRQTVALGTEGGLPSVSHVTLHRKLKLAVPFLRELVARLVQQGSAELTAERWGGYEVLAVDGTSFSSPGADGTDARVHLQLRLSDLEIVGVCAEGRAVGESYKRFVWRPGELALGDRGYANPPGIVSVVEQGADVLCRVNRSSLPMRRCDSGREVDVMAWLRSLRGHRPSELRVTVFSREHSRQVEGRLIGVRLPASQAEKARVRVRRELGGKVTDVDLEAAQYVVLFTTAPRARLPAEMCLALYRLRWQIELVFKRWKSLCRFDALPKFRDDTVLSWLYAKLLLALVMQKIATGAAPLFPPELAETGVVVDAVESGQRAVARRHRRARAA